MDSNIFSRLAAPTEFYIIRHGQSEGNLAKILQGRGEYPLSAAGRLQAAARGRYFRDKFSAGQPEKALLFSSPQGRAKETAELIAEETKLDAPLYTDLLIEMQLGIWSGKVWNDVMTDPLWNDFRSRSWDAIPEAESSFALFNRALNAWDFLQNAAAATSAKKVIVVTHGGFIQWLLKTTFQCRSWFPLFPISNCGLFTLRVEPNPDNENPGLYWDEINSPVPNHSAENRGFPS